VCRGWSWGRAASRLAGARRAGRNVRGAGHGLVRPEEACPGVEAWDDLGLLVGDVEAVLEVGSQDVHGGETLLEWRAGCSGSSPRVAAHATQNANPFAIKAMKVSDFIYRYGDDSHDPHDGICRVRVFVTQRVYVVLTDLREYNPGRSVSNSIEQIRERLIKRGHVPPDTTFFQYE